MAALKAGLDDRGRITVAQLAEIFHEPDPDAGGDLQAEEAAYRSYVTQVAPHELVDVAPEEMARIRDGIVKGQQVASEIAAEREQEARELAEQERRESEDVERLYPMYLTTLGVE